MRGLKELPHSCFSFLLQISSKPFSVKDYQLIQYLIPVPVSLRPLFDYVLAGKIQHLFQCRIAWEYAFRFRDFPILAVQSFYDICRVHNASDIIRKLVNNPVPVSLLSGDRKPQIRFLGNHHSGSGNLYHKSFRM